jgi:hypothetical protein
MRGENVWTRLALGAAAGLAGTMALNTIHKATQRWIAESSPPIKEDPGRFLLHKATQALPERARQRLYKAEGAITRLLPMGYGMTFGVLYATARPKTRRVLVEGLLLGLVAWATGYLGWLPGARLMPPIWKHKPKQVATPVAEHALYGLATAAGYRWLSKRLHV